MMTKEAASSGGGESPAIIVVNWDTAGGTVWAADPVTRIYAKKDSLQLIRNNSIPTDATPPIASGITTLNSTPNLPRPSIRPALSVSKGRFAKYPKRIQVAKGISKLRYVIIRP